MKLSWFTLCLIIGTFTAQAQTERSHLDKDVPPLLAKFNIPSVSIARIEDGKLAFAVAYGTQTPGVPATTTTLYNIASLTKPITAEVVLRLVSAGRISLDEPMDKYWSDPDLANDDRRKLLTPRIALSHRTGFANWRRQTNGVLTIQHDPGTVVGYSGEGFQYLARFTVNKTGTPLDQLAQTLIFNPAGMHDTSFTHQPWFEGRIAVPTDAQGKSLPPQFADKPSAADLVYTTPSDYAKFIISILNHTAVTPAVFAERSRIQFSEKDKMCAGDKASTCPDDVGFGLSWQVARFGNDAYLMHTGSDEGVTTLAYINLATRSATIVFTNSANGGKIYMPILESIDKDPVFLNYLRAQAR